VKIISILTVGDSIGGYRMVGIPDGVGPFVSGHDEFTLVNLGDTSSMTTGLELETASNAAHVTRVQRCEDSAWDPREGRQNDGQLLAVWIDPDIGFNDDAKRKNRHDDNDDRR